MRFVHGRSTRAAQAIQKRCIHEDDTGQKGPRIVDFWDRPSRVGGRGPTEMYRCSQKIAFFFQGAPGQTQKGLQPNRPQDRPQTLSCGDRPERPKIQNVFSIKKVILLRNSGPPESQNPPPGAPAGPPANPPLRRSPGTSKNPKCVFDKKSHTIAEIGSARVPKPPPGSPAGPPANPPLRRSPGTSKNPKCVFDKKSHTIAEIGSARVPKPDRKETHPRDPRTDHRKAPNRS